MLNEVSECGHPDGSLGLPSGELYKKLLKMAIKIVDFSIKNGGSSIAKC